MMLDASQYLIGSFSGGLVGFTLGLIGGGGSILAVPLMVYLVGVSNPHLAIGTSAFAVGANALVGLTGHARARTIEWRCGGIFSAAGVIGALVGSTAGKAFDGARLLSLLSLVMILVGALMLRGRKTDGISNAECNRENAPKVLGFGLATGVFSGFFGIGGGFLILPGLIASTRMPMLKSTGTSLIAVAAFGFTTSLNYAFSGLVDWPLALMFILGGIPGSVAGLALARRLSHQRGALKIVFAGFIFAVAFYMLGHSQGLY